MLKIKGSVGLNAVNHMDDVLVVQALLNQHRHRVVGSREIPVDGIVGPKTISAVKAFQIAFAGLPNVDARVDPDGKTWSMLNRPAPEPNVPVPPPRPNTAVPAESMCFPLRRRPHLSYKTGGRRFGAPRDDGHRLHAGCDLIAPAGTEVLSMFGGTLVHHSPNFYRGTQAVEVRHTSGMIARYCEIRGLASGVKVGSPLSRGQVIAYVGQLPSGSSMLHFEIYSGSGKGALSTNSGVYGATYRRRSDLIDPTSYLDRASTDQSAR